jgi:hypothetical protein
MKALNAPHPHIFIFSFQLHDNALALHEYTRHERKRTHLGDADRFDGELDNFQQPELSSLEKLVCSHHVSVFVGSLIAALFIEYGRYPAAMIGYH